MRALSVRQPWAELIASGRKDVEVRSWHTLHRGPLLICSGAGPLRRPPESFGLSLIDCSRGVAVAIVDLLDVVPATPEHSQNACCVVGVGEFAWILAAPRRVQQSAVRGRLMLFEVADSEIILMNRSSVSASPGTPNRTLPP
jgi:ASCH domain